MKKILSLILCLVLVASALVSCGGGEIPQPEADRPNRTLRMAIVVADEYVDENGVTKKTTEEGIAAMEKDFNDQSEVLLATHIEFECIKASEYKERMTAIMNEVYDEKSRQNAGQEDAMANAGDSTGTELSDDENKFPAASKAQFDILLIADEEMYQEYIQKGWLVGLNSHLTGSFKPLNTKILAGAKNLSMVNGVCYGVPANTAYGSYTYVKINRDVKTQYSFDYEKVTSLADVYSLINMIELADDNGLAYWNNKYPTSFSVIGTTADEFVLPNVQYLSSDLASNSLFGSVYDYKLDMGSVGLLNDAGLLLENSEYTSYLKLKFNGQLAGKGYFLDAGETVDDCIVGLAKGDYELSLSDPDYYYAPVALPEFVKSELFGGMLAVSTASIDEKRSLEIVQELMTNATKADLLNILLYGDEETNYSMEEGCVVYRKNSNYHVDENYFFGNLCELAYPCADFGQTAETYTYVAKHINDLSQRQPLFDDYFHLYFSQIDAEQWNAFDEYCDEKYAYLMDSADMDEFNVRLAEILTEMKDAENFAFYALVEPYATSGTYSSIGGAFIKYRDSRRDDPTKLDPFAKDEEPTA